MSKEAAALVDAFVEEEFSSAAALILGRLRTFGTLTLKELCDQSSTLTTQQVRSQLGNLLAHGCVKFDSGDQTYQYAVGGAMIRVVFPVLLEHVHRHFGELGEVVTLVLHKDAALPQETLVDYSVRTRPSLLESDIQTVVKNMTVAGYLVISGGPSTRDGTAAPPAKKQRSGEATSSAVGALQLNSMFVLHRIRSELTVELVKQEFTGAAAVVVQAVINADGNKQPSHPDSASEFPKFPAVSSPLPSSALQRACPGLSQSVFGQTIATLTADGESSFLLRRASRAGSSDPEFVINYSLLCDELKMRRCEAYVKSRFGVVGLRVVRLLFEKVALDERQIAEDVLAALGDVRPVLSALQKDGLLRLLEVPRINTADRHPKNSFFLWQLKREHLVEVVHERINKAMLILSGKLRSMGETQEHNAAGEDATLTAKTYKAISQEQLNCVHGGVFSLAQSVLLFSYF